MPLSLKPAPAFARALHLVDPPQVEQKPAAAPLDPAPSPAPVSRPDLPGAAKRFDAGKPRWDLLPPDAMNELVQVYTVGAAKYGDRNWEKGMAWSRCFGSLMRHAWAWIAGERNDPETGCHHMAHVAWNALALVAYQTRNRGQDDRLSGGPPPSPQPAQQAAALPPAGGSEAG